MYYILLLFSLLLQTHVVQLLRLCGVEREERDTLKMFTREHFKKSVKYSLVHNVGQSKNPTVPSQSDAPEKSDL